MARSMTSFELQDDVTSAVIGAIAPHLERAEIDLSTRKSTSSLAAYDLYLRAIACTYQNTREANDESHRLLQEALRLDGKYALVCALLANRYSGRKANGWMVDREQESKEARYFARRAAQLANDDAQVFANAGYALVYVGFELDEGAALLDRAVRLNDNYAPACFWSGYTKVFLGKEREAREFFDRVVRLILGEQGHSAPKNPHDRPNQFEHRSCLSGSNERKPCCARSRVTARPNDMCVGPRRILSVPPQRGSRKVCGRRSAGGLSRISTTCRLAVILLPTHKEDPFTCFRIENISLIGVTRTSSLLALWSGKDKLCSRRLKHLQPFTTC